MAKQTRANDQDLYVGLVRLHVLHHACEEPIFGLGMIRELTRHGYRLGPGTIYPLLRSMERRGWLRSTPQVVEGRRRMSYTATGAGRRALREAKGYVRELFQEMMDR